MIREINRFEVRKTVILSGKMHWHIVMRSMIRLVFTTWCKQAQPGETSGFFIHRTHP